MQVLPIVEGGDHVAYGLLLMREALLPLLFGGCLGITTTTTIHEELVVV